MKEIDVLELKAWREQGKEHQLVDVREPHEYEAGNMGGVHIPMGDILLRQGELKADIPVVMQCRSTAVVLRQWSPRCRRSSAWTTSTTSKGGHRPGRTRSTIRWKWPDMARRGPKAWLGLGIRGMAMGAADLVPGVSGGTVAFIAGIYEELLTTIGGLGLGTLRALFREGQWPRRRYNLGLAVLAAGMGASVLLLAGLLHHLLETQPVLLWAFFFGLVAASIPLMLRAIAPEDRRRLRQWACWPSGRASPGGSPDFLRWFKETPPLFLFCSGAIAICAMILPGISGSFILVLLGAYSAVIGAISVGPLARGGFWRRSGHGPARFHQRPRMGVPAAPPWPSPC